MDNSELLLVLGRNLKKYRERRHFTQEQLAEKVGISYPFYANLERGGKGVSIYTLKRLSDALGVSTDSLLTDISPNENINNLMAFLEGKPDPFLLTADAVIRALYESHFE